MIVMRPDLIYTVHMLPKNCQRLSTRAAASLTGALLYAYNTRSMKLTLGGNNTQIIGYADSNLASCRLSRLSLGSNVVYLGFGPVEWSTKKQILPTDATAVAELLAANKPTRTIQWLRWLLFETKIKEAIQNESSLIYSDNSSHCYAHQPS